MSFVHPRVVCEIGARWANLASSWRGAGLHGGEIRDDERADEAALIADQGGILAMYGLVFSAFSMGAGATSLPPAVFSSSFLRSVMIR